MSVEGLTGRALIDTNVLIYATLTADSRHERARQVLAQRLRLEVELFVSVQNLAEMYPNLTGPKNQPPDSPSLARDKIASLSQLHGLTVLPLTVEITRVALDLCVEGAVTRQNYFDRQLAALMIREKIPLIVTENTGDFQNIPGISSLNPFV